MRRHGCDPLAHALYAQLEADQEQRIRCQRGEHDMLATASPGVVVCRGLTLPHGACVVVCAKHIGAVQWQARHHRTGEARTPYTKEGQQHDPR
jgi:hypothetical protein